jgi:hypothetical protein
MSFSKVLRDLFRRTPPSREDIAAVAEARRLRDDMQTIRLSQRSTAGENYQSGRGSRQ